MSEFLPPVPAGLIRVKREGGRGYRLIAAAKFNPKVHERFDAPAPPPPPPIMPPPPRIADPLAELPADWSTKLPADRLKDVALAATGRAVENRKQAIEVITEELAKRAS